jgi:hypothetical protein
MRPPKDEGEARREAELEKPGDEGGDVHSNVDLKSLIPNNPKLLEAMEYFLLASPERQLGQLGDLDNVRKTAEQSQQSGNLLMARINYESAAKIALYEENKGAFQDMLSSAQKVTPPEEKYGEYHTTLLNNIDTAMQVAKQYYSRIPHGTRNAV